MCCALCVTHGIGYKNVVSVVECTCGIKASCPAIEIGLKHLWGDVVAEWRVTEKFILSCIAQYNLLSFILV